MKASPFTHIAAVAAGLLIAALIGKGHSGAAASTVKPSTPARDSSAGSSAHLTAEQKASIEAEKQRQDGIASLRSRDFRKAWDAIVDQSLPPQQRHSLQFTLLKQWAEIDLEAALSAAFENSWDQDNHTIGIRNLLQAFTEQFAKRPTESWDLITSGKFGLGAALAKERWAHTVVRDNPLLVVNSFAEIPYNTRSSIFPQILAGIQKDPSKIGDYYDKLSELPHNSQFLDFVQKSIEALGPRGSTDEIRDKFLNAPTDAQKSILVHEFGKSLATSGIDAIKSHLAQFPEEDRGRMLRSVAIHTPAGDHTMQLAEMILHAGEYKQIYIQLNQRLREYASEPAKQPELANWAINLPRTPETHEVIHRSVEPYIAANPQGAREWLDTLPSSWAKDYALAEYSQQLVWKKGDSDASWWAINQISDPKLKQTVTQWRSGWKPR